MRGYLHTKKFYTVSNTILSPPPPSRPKNNLLKLLTHETDGEGVVGTDLAVDLQETLLDDLLSLLAGQGVTKTVAEENDNGEGLTELVRTR
jgi:hypothetical protein